MDARKDRAVTRSSKRKRTTTDDQPLKKFKDTVELRTYTVDKLRNYLRVVDFEHPKSKEGVETKSVRNTNIPSEYSVTLSL